MSKIGIFGDSFGCQALTPDLGDPNLGMQYHWATLLANELGADLGIEAVSGSPAFYSYKKIMEKHQEYDQIIFIVTDCARYPIDVGSESVFVSSADQIKYIMNDVSPSTQVELSKIAAWFDVEPYEYLINMNDLMVDKIRSIRPDTIFLATNEHSFTSEKFAELGLEIEQNLTNLFFEQLAQLDISSTSFNISITENPTLISGHFVPEMHNYFYEVFKHRYDTGQWNWKPVPRLKFNYSPEQYYPFI